MTTRGIFALVLLTTACSSTTATYADRDQEETMGGASSVASTSPGASKAMGSVSATASGGSSVAPTSGGSASSAADAAGGTSASSTLDLPAAGGAHDRFSFPAQLPASGGSDAAGGSSAVEAAGGSRPVMVAVPAGTAGTTSAAGSSAIAGAAGGPQLYVGSDGQVHPITDSPLSVYDYDQFVSINCGTMISSPYDLCEPVDTSLPPGEWTWRAKRFDGNPLISSCVSAGDAACGRIHMADVCGRDVLPDGTCGPNPHFEPACGKTEIRLDVTCLRICLSCTDIPGVNRPPSVCPNAKTAITVGMPGATCPTY